MPAYHCQKRCVSVICGLGSIGASGDGSVDVFWASPEFALEKGFHFNLTHRASSRLTHKGCEDSCANDGRG